MTVQKTFDTQEDDLDIALSIAEVVAEDNEITAFYNLRRVGTRYQHEGPSWKKLVRWSFNYGPEDDPARAYDPAGPYSSGVTK
jgi:hypothetical protein